MHNQVAKALLELKAVHLQPNDFFTWTSGIKSPIYCDNRMLISHPTQRKMIVSHFVNLIRQKFPKANCIAGTATAGIPWAAWIAEQMDLPMVYIRSKAKDYGRKSAIEGDPAKDSKIVIIEDLISTGKSSLAAAEEVKKANVELLGVVSIFSYGLPVAAEKFKAAQLDFASLCTLDNLLTYAGENQLLTTAEIEIIAQWSKQIEIN